MITNIGIMCDQHNDAPAVVGFLNQYYCKIFLVTQIPLYAYYQSSSPTESFCTTEDETNVKTPSARSKHRA